MILIDTAIWIDHLRSPDARVSHFLERNDVLGHPFVVGEISLGSLKNRQVILAALSGLPQALVARDEEVQSFIFRHALFGIGIGYIDAHLLASVQLTPDALLWTRDKRLQMAAERLGLAMIGLPNRPN